MVKKSHDWLASRVRQVASPLARWAGHWNLGRRSRQARETIRRIETGLAEVSQSTEGVFLLVGERLAALQTHAHEIAAEAYEIAGLHANDAGSLAALDEVLKAAGGDRRDEDTETVIVKIEENATAIQEAIQAIRPLVKTFDVLGVMTRIESARCEGEGAMFAGLADAVTKLSRGIREQIDTTAAAAAELLGTISRAAEQVRQAAQKHHENLGPLTSQTSAGVMDIGNHRNLVAEATKVYAARFEGVSRSVGEVVTALQAHDIVRQQIERVLEALRRAGASASSQSDTARLQAAQLSHSRSIFETSVHQIRDELAHIERGIGEVAEESARILGLSGANRGCSLTAVESDLAGILGILESNANADRLLGEAAVSIQDRVSEISLTIADIHSIGIQMQHIAMNATLRAAHLGPGGGALEIVAHSIQALARETELATATLEARLGTVRDAASALSEVAGARDGAEAQIAHLRGSASALVSIEDKARGQYARSVALTEDLRRQIRETIAAFGTHEESLRAMEAASQELDGLAADAWSADSADPEQTTSLYTMHSERAVHAALYSADSPDQRLTLDASSLAPAGADNVEFF